MFGMCLLRCFRDLCCCGFGPLFANERLSVDKSAIHSECQPNILKAVLFYGGEVAHSPPTRNVNAMATLCTTSKRATERIERHTLFKPPICPDLHSILHILRV